MARQAKEPKAAKSKSIEETLWDSANKLRGSVEPAEYKHVVLGLIFLKFASDKFEAHRAAMVAKGQSKYLEMAEFYGKANVFYLAEDSRWSFLMSNAKQSDLALKIDTALHNIEKANKALKGALPDNYFSRIGLDTTKLASLLDTINDIDTLKDKSQDIVGRVYEYFLSKFALAEGKGKGEFYTPKCIVNLIAEMIEPYRGIIYDPACGSGGMFVQSIKFIESHHGNKQEVSIYGQEYTNTTYKLAKMNLAIRGIAANLGEKAADTFLDDQHKDLKADFIMANPEGLAGRKGAARRPALAGFCGTASEQRQLRLDSQHGLQAVRKRRGGIHSGQWCPERRRRGIQDPQAVDREQSGGSDSDIATGYVLYHEH